MFFQKTIFLLQAFWPQDLAKKIKEISCTFTIVTEQKKDQLGMGMYNTIQYNNFI